MIRKLIAALLICGIIVFSFYQFYNFLKRRIVTSDLKLVTEKRIGTFLKAPVRINQIKIGLLKHISLTGLEISHLEKGNPLLLIGVKRIVVRYDLGSFLKRNFRVPTQIFLDAPRMTLEAFQAFNAPFDFDLLRSDHGILTRFEFEEGEVQLPWFRPNAKFRMVGVEGQAVPKKGNLFDVRLKSRLADVASGTLLAFGEINPNGKAYHLVVTLSGVQFSGASRIPITELNGTIEFINDTVQLENVKFLFRGIPCELSGEIEKIFSEKPIFSLALQIRETRFPTQLKVRVDFSKGTVSGTVSLAQQSYEFSGSLSGKPEDFELSKLIVNNAYEVSARFNTVADLYHLEMIRQNQRFQLNLSIGDFVWNLILKLDHFKLFGFDVVTSASVILKPYEEAWQKGERIFDVEMKTDYLIFQYQPLRDFAMSARLSFDGMNEILAHWGNVCELRGAISFGRVPRGDLVLGVGPLDLSEFRSFGLHPLPLALVGILEGKLLAQGPLERLNLSGAFTIGKGIVGSLKYDRAILNFSGNLPYLLLDDSKIVKGKNSFMLEGGLDFARQNFLEGARVKSSEHIVIWKGLELNSELDGLARKKSTFSPDSDRATEWNQGARSAARIGAEYQLGDRTSLHVTAEEDQAQKEYLAVGPKMKF